MSTSTKILLLFALNWLDAQLTLFWVRNGFATEGNGLMALLLDAGDAPFLAAKLLAGTAAAYVLYRFSAFPVARRGLRLVLGIYVGLMFFHAATGLSACGLVEPETAVAFVARLPETLLALVS